MSRYHREMLTQRSIALVPILLLSMTTLGCSSDEGKAVGSECFGSAECAVGLTCDFGQTPSICASGQTPLPVDAANVAEADAEIADAQPGAPDATVGPTPDARVGPTSDAAVIVPDAMIAVPDAALPDAALPDATLPDAA